MVFHIGLQLNTIDAAFKVKYALKKIRLVNMNQVTLIELVYTLRIHGVLVLPQMREYVPGGHKKGSSLSQ